MDSPSSSVCLWPPRHPHWHPEDPALGVVVNCVTLSNGLVVSVGENYRVLYDGGADSYGVAHILAVHPSSKSALAWWFYTREDFNSIPEIAKKLPAPSLDGKQNFRSVVDACVHTSNSPRSAYYMNMY